MILALDVSTSTTGFCIIDSEGETIRLGAWETKNKNRYPDLFKKAEFIEEKLLEIKAQYPITKIYIEKPFMFFNSGGSSAKTMASLQRFNGVVSWLCYSIFKYSPYYLTAKEARKLNDIKVPKGIKGIDTKKFILKWVLDNQEGFEVEYTPRGNPKPKYYDISDAVVLAKAGLSEGKNKRKI